MVSKLIIFKLIKLFLYKNHPLLKPKKYNYFTKGEEDLANIPFILILLILLYFYKRIITISGLKYFIKRKLQN